MRLSEFADKQLKLATNAADKVGGLSGRQGKGAVSIMGPSSGGLAKSGGEGLLQGSDADVTAKRVGSRGFEGRGGVGAALA